MEGYIKLHRTLLKWEWIDNPNVLAVFIHCLLKANYQDTKWHGIEVERGTFLTSVNKLSKSTGLTYKQVRNALEKLIETGEIETKSKDKKYTIIKVCKYDEYQIWANKGQSITQVISRDSGVIHNGTGRTEGEQRAIDKNIKNNPYSNYIYNNAHAREENEPRVIGHLNVKTSESKKLFADKVKLKRA